MPGTFPGMFFEGKFSHCYTEEKGMRTMYEYY
ncbi:hypothetical protein BSG1_05440 [Bacillus sp. SG-1]|nr:hypothetical protein BSG1_05440 [Bacillus sp. SG-1]